MTNISRQDLIAEELIRTHIRKRIEKNILERYQSEKILRKNIRHLLEAETGDEEPSTYTGINVLANVLEKVIPVIEDDYKMLTTSSEQRESFRNHIVHAIKNSLSPIDATTKAEKVSESFEFSINKSKLVEELKINLDPQTDGEEAASVQGEFIDIDPDEDTDDFVEIEDQNETGRNFAATTFTKVEKQIVDAFDMLADEEDQKLFYDYLVTNMLLYFDKFEDELQNQLPSTTTPEYEEEKEEGEKEDSASSESSEEDIFN
jgi:hypothetical protein